MSEKFNDELTHIILNIGMLEKKLAKMLDNVDINECSLYKYAVYMARLNNDSIQKYLDMYRDKFDGCNN